MMTLSRGQQKLFVCALLLAQASLYEKHSGKPVIMLIDDLPAELDAKHRETLLKLLDLLHIQHILTSTADDLIPILNPETARRWHIDNGGITVETM
jgi:DNA replication and repair protein RecF